LSLCAGSIALISGKPIAYLSGLARQLGLQYPILSGENGAIVYYSKDFPPQKSLIITAAEKEVRILENLRLDIVKKFGNKVWIQPNMLNLTIFQKTEKYNTPQKLDRAIWWMITC
jgi:hydroxymethylpyrimidine pyrophosphatase-like HAD family hydrolase